MFFVMPCGIFLVKNRKIESTSILVLEMKFSLSLALEFILLIVVVVVIISYICIKDHVEMQTQGLHMFVLNLPFHGLVWSLSSITLSGVAF